MLNLLKTDAKCSTRELKAALHVGDGRIKKAVSGEENKKPGGLNGFQISDLEREFMIDYLYSLPSEEGNCIFHP